MIYNIIVIVFNSVKCDSCSQRIQIVKYIGESNTGKLPKSSSTVEPPLIDTLCRWTPANRTGQSDRPVHKWNGSVLRTYRTGIGRAGPSASQFSRSCKRGLPTKCAGGLSAENCRQWCEVVSSAFGIENMRDSATRALSCE